MRDAQARQYRAKLQNLLADIERQDQRGREGQRTVTLDQQAVGRLSRMDAMQHQAMANATQARRDIMKRRIAGALARIDEGEFGYCTECGDEIAAKRLDLNPTALTCVPCATGQPS